MLVQLAQRHEQLVLWLVDWIDSGDLISFIYVLNIYRVVVKSNLGHDR